MTPLPNLNDDTAMLLRGRRSALASARNEAAEALRDACTLIQGADFDEVGKLAAEVMEIAERLRVIATKWGEL